MLTTVTIAAPLRIAYSNSQLSAGACVLYATNGVEIYQDDKYTQSANSITNERPLCPGLAKECTSRIEQGNVLGPVLGHVLYRSRLLRPLSAEPSMVI